MPKWFKEAVARAPQPRNNVRSAIRTHNRVILDAEYQLAFGHSLFEMRRARDNLRTRVPGCQLLEALKEKIARAKATDHQPFGTWDRII